MKKLFSLFFIGLLSISLIACETNGENELDSLRDEITALENELDAVNEETETLYESLSLSARENERITFVIEGSTREITSITVNVSRTAFELLYEVVGEDNISYSESEFGIFIHSLYDLAPDYGAYIMISKNGIPLEVGIDSASFEPGDIFTFEEVYWDTLAESLDQSIDAFLNSDLTNFYEPLSYELVTAFSQLNEMPEVTFEPKTSTLNDLVKTILTLRALNKPVETYQAMLIEELIFDAPFLASLTLMALAGTEDYETYELRYLSFIENTDVDSLSLDETAIIAMTLGEATPLNIQEVLKEKVASATNSPSLAYAIMGLIRIGEDPRTTSHDIHENVVLALLHLQALDGGFLYTYDSTPSFMRTFSSPQSFLALVTLKYYMNGTTINPYTTTP